MLFFSGSDLYKRLPEVKTDHIHELCMSMLFDMQQLCQVTAIQQVLLSNQLFRQNVAQRNMHPGVHRQLARSNADCS